MIKNLDLRVRIFNLIIKASDQYDYICFSDQDDIWFKEKISTGIKNATRKISRL